MTRAERVKKDFLNILYSIQKETDNYIIFQKPSALIGKVYDNNPSQFVVWNKNKQYRSYHAHSRTFKEALDIVEHAEAGVVLPFRDHYAIESTLRILDMGDDLWYKYLAYIMKGDIVTKNIEKVIGGRRFEVRFNVYFPCPVCRGVRYDDIEEMGVKCCHQCGKIY